MPSKRPRPSDATAELMKRRGVVRAKDLREVGMHGRELTFHLELGRIRRLDRGLYETTRGLRSSLGALAVRVPRGVVCLLSALHVYRLIDTEPPEMWMAIPSRARRPHVTFAPVRFLRFSEACLSEGLETGYAEEVPVTLFTAEKTLADCFKYRHKLGLGLVEGALERALKRPDFEVPALLRFARLCRVEKRVRRYLERSSDWSR